MSDPQTISAEKLCALTGLTDRRHRQLAKEGYFPPPIKSQYQLTPTISGMFRYYREYNARLKNKKEAIDDEKHRKLKLENDQSEGLLTNTARLATELSAALIPIREELRQKLEAECPMAMSGMDVPEARIIGKRLCDDVFEKIGAVFKRWEI